MFILHSFLNTRKVNKLSGTYNYIKGYLSASKKHSSTKQKVVFRALRRQQKQNR